VKPRRLILENFGAYRRKTEVDFDRLGPLFLVWGKTGSGKTTIFDAMTYALYGKAPGSRGGLERQLWSQLAQPGERPLVEFQFSLGGRDYRAVRSPPYRRKKRGGDLGEAPAEAALFELGESGAWRLVADKITEVDAAVEERIGLTEEEFSKIILLPQGEFQRFLDMDSTARVSVLEKLFPVAAHDAVARLAKDESKAALAAVQRVDTELSRLGGSSAAEEEAAELGRAEDLAAGLAAERASALEALNAAESALRAAREGAERARQAAEARRALAELEAQVPEARSRADRIAAARAAQSVLHRTESREVAERELETARTELVVRRAELALLEERAVAMEADRARTGRLVGELSALDQKIGELERSAAAWAGVEAARSAHEAARSSAAFAEEAEARSAEAEAKLRAAVQESLVGSEEEERIRLSFEESRIAAESAAVAMRVAKDLAALGETAAKRLAEAETLERAALDAARDRDRAGADLAARTALAAQHSAVLLALSLVDGHPCPVCGSTSHPSPALSDSSDDVDLEAARSRFSAALSRAGSTAGRAEAARQAADAAQAALAAARSDRPEASLSVAEAEKRAAALGAELARAAESLRGMEERRKLAGQLLVKLEEARLLHAEAARAHSLRREELAGRQAAFSTAAANAGGEDPGPLLCEARAERAATALELERIQKALSSWSDERSKADALAVDAARRVPVLESRFEVVLGEERAAASAAGFSDVRAARKAALESAALKALEDEAKIFDQQLAAARAACAAHEYGRAEAEANAESLEAFTEAARSARQTYDQAQSDLEAAQAERMRLAARVAERARLAAERAALDARWAALSALSALLNGELSGRRLPFKNYVLGMYFRVVVERASSRLAQLSDGRYALIADEGVAAGKGKIGLDLLVRDSFTGQNRSAGTLSGGERFLTSLGLALGLADTIRDRSGGASLEAIFIDEGFGSLDEETLDRAISSLDEVRGTRIIGIVSHVAELRNRIPSRIEVSKGREGSTLRIVG
jgi:exonuclease SbcC